MKKSRLTVIIPFLNEEENIPGLVDALNGFFGGEKEYTAEVIFVNDGSTDNSPELLKRLNHKTYSSKLISFSKNFGSHAALRAGILNSTGDYVTFMYADLQDPLHLIDEMYASITKSGNEDVIWATRKSTENSFFETTFSKMYSGLMRKYVSKSYPDKGFDIVMFSEKVKGLLNVNIEANSSIFLQILTLGFKQSFIFYDKQPRKKGKSKWTLSKKIKLFIDSFIAFSYTPIRFVTAVGIVLFILGIFFSGYLITRKLVYNDLVSGWPMLLSILTIGFGITNISLGIIAEYLWRTLDSARKRPVFIIDEIIELKTND
jgi:glycosyltransferase involved in cell wall biosynthesis